MLTVVERAGACGAINDVDVHTYYIYYCKGGFRKLIAKSLCLLRVDEYKRSTSLYTSSVRKLWADRLSGAGSWHGVSDAVGRRAALAGAPQGGNGYDYYKLEKFGA